MLNKLIKRQSVRTRLRRWWKGYKSEVKYKGYIKPIAEDFMPGYYKLNRLYWNIRWRTVNVYHKVDTGLKPGYYEIEDLLLHSSFNLLVMFVEHEYGGVAVIEKRITDLSKWEADELKDLSPEHVESFKISYERQRNELKEALELYHWWKDVYPKYEDNDPLMSKNGDIVLVGMDHFKECSWDKDGDPTLFEWKDNCTPEQKKMKEEIYEASRIYNEMVEIETTDNFIRLIKLRHALWT